MYFELYFCPHYVWCFFSDSWCKHIYTSRAVPKLIGVIQARSEGLCASMTRAVEKLIWDSSFRAQDWSFQSHGSMSNLKPCRQIFACECSQPCHWILNSPSDFLPAFSRRGWKKTQWDSHGFPISGSLWCFFGWYLWHGVACACGLSSITGAIREWDIAPAESSQGDASGKWDREAPEGLSAIPTRLQSSPSATSPTPPAAPQASARREN